MTDTQALQEGKSAIGVSVIISNHCQVPALWPSLKWKVDHCEQSVRVGDLL